MIGSVLQATADLLNIAIHLFLIALLCVLTALVPTAIVALRP